MGAAERAPDAGEIDRHNSDSSDYEEIYVKKKGKKTKKVLVLVVVLVLVLVLVIILKKVKSLSINTTGHTENRTHNHQ